MQSLAKIRDELTTGQEKLSSAVQTLDRELSELQKVCSGLEEEQVKLQKTLQSLEAAGEEVDPDEVNDSSILHRVAVPLGHFHLVFDNADYSPQMWQ
jgi:predicted nuclease with TOPRIM domain